MYVRVGTDLHEMGFQRPSLTLFIATGRQSFYCCGVQQYDRRLSRIDENLYVCVGGGGGGVVCYAI